MKDRLGIAIIQASQPLFDRFAVRHPRVDRAVYFVLVAEHRLVYEPLDSGRPFEFADAIRHTLDVRDERVQVAPGFRMHPEVIAQCAKDPGVARRVIERKVQRAQQVGRHFPP